MIKGQYEGDQTPIERIRNLISMQFNFFSILKDNNIKDIKFLDNEYLNNFLNELLQSSISDVDKIKDYLDDINEFYELTEEFTKSLNS
jgi:hypothetical protein